MMRTMLKSKVHRATVTQADLHYVGSVTVDEDLMDETEAKAYLPKVVHVDAANRVVELGADPSAPVPGADDQQRSPQGVPVR